MTTPTIAHVDIRRALTWGALLAALWVAVAFLRPAMTFHLAPFLIAAAPPVLLVMEEVDIDRASVLRIGALSSALALGTALLLVAIGAMEGPAFEVFPSSLVEVVAFTAGGAISGIGFGWWRTR